MRIVVPIFFVFSCDTQKDKKKRKYNFSENSIGKNSVEDERKQQGYRSFESETYIFEIA